MAIIDTQLQPEHNATSAMLCTANDLLCWDDFPKGLSVLLLDKDSNSAAKMKTRLEEMNYIVSMFENENEALLAITSKSVEFHVAIVEINSSNRNEVFRFLENAKDLPTILMSDVHCLTTTMQCIALGAVEFLQKPLSDDKLRNIWQHVVHKAFNAGGQDISKSLKPVKESLASILQLKSTNGEANVVKSDETEHSTSMHDIKHEILSAPSTPQLNQRVRSLGDGECQDQTNISMEQDSGEPDGESKSVEITYSNSVSETAPVIHQPVQTEGGDIKRECESSPEPRGQNGNSTRSEGKDVRANGNKEHVDPKKSSGVNSSSGTKATKKKLKVDWTPELHKKFVQAVDQLGIDQAIPSRILELMKVEGLTRHNIASHLQKYRMHRRQILPKEDERRWLLRDSTTHTSRYPYKPIMVYPQPVPAGGQFYSGWSNPGSYPGVHMWGPPYHYPPWQPTEVYNHAWGCPVVPQPQGSYPTYPQSSGHYRSDGAHDRYDNKLEKTFDFQPAEEVIDRVVKEAINNPWLPLPLGLKAPSTDSVLNELSKQGISNVPSSIIASDLF